ncbi:hypothetical protein CA599_29915 [Paenibacillus taichungensis]|nr:hypothetical protein CA599_29915 [Paenibacillus taichungensis]
MQKLVTDITYVRIGHDFAYLSVVMELYNNEIIAWELSERNDLKLVIETVKKLKCGPTLLHSDQGFQYTTQSYAKLLEEKKLTRIHSRCGNCYDNACIESFFSHMYVVLFEGDIPISSHIAPHPPTRYHIYLIIIYLQCIDYY